MLFCCYCCTGVSKTIALVLPCYYLGGVDKAGFHSEVGEDGGVEELGVEAGGGTDSVASREAGQLAVRVAEAGALPMGRLEIILGSVLLKAPQNPPPPPKLYKKLGILRQQIFCTVLRTKALFCRTTRSCIIRP